MEDELIKMITNLELNFKDEITEFINNNYLYHSTLVENIDSIRNEGLRLENLNKSRLCPEKFQNLPQVTFANARNILRVEEGFLLNNLPTEEELSERVILRVKAENITRRIYSLDYTDNTLDVFIESLDLNIPANILFECIFAQIGTLACYDTIPFAEIEIIQREQIS